MNLRYRGCLHALTKYTSARVFGFLSFSTVILVSSYRWCGHVTRVFCVKWTSIVSAQYFYCCEPSDVSLPSCQHLDLLSLLLDHLIASRRYLLRMCSVHLLTIFYHLAVVSSSKLSTSNSQQEQSCIGEGRGFVKWNESSMRATNEG